MFASKCAPRRSYAREHDMKLDVELMYNTTRYVSAVRSDLGFRSADPAGCISTTATACALPMMSLGWWASWAGARLDEVPGAVVELEAVAPGGGVQHLRLHGHPRAPRRQAGLQLAVQILQRRLQGTTEFVIFISCAFCGIHGRPDPTFIIS